MLIEGRRKRDIYLWAANVARGPSVKFEVCSLCYDVGCNTVHASQVENIHTMAELKLTGNCLAASRPLLSFCPSFGTDTHWQLIRELLTGIFGVPNHHPKSQVL